MPIHEQPHGNNRILGCLSDPELELLKPGFERIHLTRSALLAEPDAPLDYAYFPISCVLSTIVVLQNGASVEASMAGNEGMVPIGLTVDQATSSFRIVPQIPGECLRIRTPAFREALDEIPRLRELLHRYCVALYLQASQNAACNIRHTTEERLARWLVVCADRSGQDEFELTQEFLSVMLGVRRQSVNVTVGALQRAGVIAFRRGRIAIMDRAGLEAVACECYRVNVEAYNEVMQMECADGVRAI